MYLKIINHSKGATSFLVTAYKLCIGIGYTQFMTRIITECLFYSSSIRKLKAKYILRVALTLMGILPEEWLHVCMADFGTIFAAWCTAFAFKDPLLPSSACADCVPWASQCSLLLFYLNGFWKTSIYHIIINFSNPTYTHYLFGYHHLLNFSAIFFVSYLGNQHSAPLKKELSCICWSGSFFEFHIYIHDYFRTSCPDRWIRGVALWISSFNSCWELGKSWYWFQQ